MKLNSFVLLLFIICSCKKEDDHNKANNNVKEIRSQLKDGYYYVKFLENNLVMSEGKFYQNQKIGNWKYYNHKGKLDKILEYIDSCGVQYLNRGWYYDKNAKLIQNKSNFYNIDIKRKNYEINEVIDIKLKYYPIINKKSKSFVCLSTDLEKNLCNLNTAKLDTVYSKNNDFYIRMSFSTKGKKHIRGYVREYYNQEKNQLFGERTVFFNITVNIDNVNGNVSN